MRKTLYIFTFVLGLAMTAISALADTLTAKQAFDQAMAGEIVVLDIRSRGEWKETGLASVAVPLSMHERTFLSGLDKVKQDHPDKKIALICATGGRSAWLQAELAKRGLTSAIDIPEGMMGARGLPGWIARGLPLKKFE